MGGNEMKSLLGNTPVPASAAGTVSAIHLVAAYAASKSGLLLLRSFLLSLLFRFRHVGSPGYGLVRGRSIYTRNKITSKRARKCEVCARSRDASPLPSTHHSIETMNFHSSGSTGVMERRLPLRRRTMFLSCF